MLSHKNKLLLSLFINNKTFCLLINNNKKKKKNIAINIVCKQFSIFCINIINNVKKEAKI